MITRALTRLAAAFGRGDFAHLRAKPGASRRACPGRPVWCAFWHNSPPSSLRFSSCNCLSVSPFTEELTVTSGKLISHCILSLHLCCIYNAPINRQRCCVVPSSNSSSLCALELTDDCCNTLRTYGTVHTTECLQAFVQDLTLT